MSQRAVRTYFRTFVRYLVDYKILWTLTCRIGDDLNLSPYVPTDLQLSEPFLTPIKRGSPGATSTYEVRYFGTVELASTPSSPRTMPSKAKDGLSNDEIWDDTALIRSWDDALEEYKVSAAIIQAPTGSHRVLTAEDQLYHSIHARGERVEDVLMEATNTA